MCLMSASNRDLINHHLLLWFQGTRQEKWWQKFGFLVRNALNFHLLPLKNVFCHQFCYLQGIQRSDFISDTTHPSVKAGYKILPYFQRLRHNYSNIRPNIIQNTFLLNHHTIYHWKLFMRLLNDPLSSYL